MHLDSLFPFVNKKPNNQNSKAGNTGEGENNPTAADRLNDFKKARFEPNDHSESGSGSETDVEQEMFDIGTEFGNGDTIEHTRDASKKKDHKQNDKAKFVPFSVRSFD